MKIKMTQVSKKMWELYVNDRKTASGTLEQIEAILRITKLVKELDDKYRIGT